MYRLYDEEGDFMRVVKRKEEAEHFVQYYGWTMKFFRQENKKKEVLKQFEEALDTLHGKYSRMTKEEEEIIIKIAKRF